VDVGPNLGARVKENLLSGADGAANFAADDAACDFDLPLDYSPLADHKLRPGAHGALDPTVDAKVAGKLEFTSNRAPRVDETVE
jgi:hypothetical protein